ncbi:MAG: glycoside hydrolase [Clostridiales bacterium]|nr:glycoside hydrolase [Clostridiales bacterium]
MEDLSKTLKDIPDDTELEKIMHALTELFTRRLFTAGDGYVSYRIPGIAAQADGTLLCCLEARSDRFSDWGDIDIIALRLDKEGNELSRTVFPSGGGALNNPVLCALENGRALLLYCREYERAFVRVSEDWGASFGEEREITDCLKGFPYKWNVCALGPGHALRTSGGRIVCPLWLANGKKYDGGRREHRPSVCGCIYSDDGGETWRRGFMFDGAKNQSETAACELDGEILFTIRQENAEHLRLFAKSGDGGETLSETAFSGLPDPVCFASLCGGGEGAYLVNCLDGQKRQNLSVSFSVDGETWQTLYTLPGGAGYGDIALVGDRLYVFSETTYDLKSVDALELRCFALRRD